MSCAPVSGEGVTPPAGGSAPGLAALSMQGRVALVTGGNGGIGLGTGEALAAGAAGEVVG